MGGPLSRDKVDLREPMVDEEEAQMRKAVAESSLEEELRQFREAEVEQSGREAGKAATRAAEEPRYMGVGKHSLGEVKVGPGRGGTASLCNELMLSRQAEARRARWRDLGNAELGVVKDGLARGGLAAPSGPVAREGGVPAPMLGVSQEDPRGRGFGTAALGVVKDGLMGGFRSTEWTRGHRRGGSCSPEGRDR